MDYPLDIDLDWFNELSEYPLLIAGPCSAESEEQMLRTAEYLVETKKVSVFRAGLWKPRTRPGSFEGVGAKGLPWLKKVKQETGIKIMTELARADHLDSILEAGVDMIWIGARTTTNPFAIEEIASRLKEVDIPVFVKNPLHPDMGLWLGALERINKAGVRKLAAIHRGFYPFEKSDLRHIPKWEIPIDLMIRCPGLPLVCDPSHIAGLKDIVPGIAQRAMDLHMDGLMIEVHPEPEVALSDAQQQLNFESYTTLLDNLVLRSNTFKQGEIQDLLTQYRNQIDSVDAQIFELLAQRMDLVDKIGGYKRDHKVAILQLERWTEVLRTRTAMAVQLGIGDKFIKKILDLIHQESIRIQSKH
ncbi:MAG: bifunctional 3-deoxy-7-phosphoheptulonate synthase/chorismate mutase type II [Bacteroidetes bacterium]|jgi:chorismate mutase|nr:bifunctional 3-deoxy-7-phosphoheptulonate synthase/chorismate mutase type II [Bacteroidota bacterium]MBT4400204.1 bifunctional 3-deoxy-7-phosphoheptulonate synthase/chorismate mutase type II [Bacteroidota bacterium]MBT7094927.1 bifunctional 3-deoxy-7-phosphoheptulonate synthase/chorismate mutase type II [Bacteroidota bacterium]MBT7463328.1 bifunctional 3-deoxy-7-phosphoheptulonate synthase/chorismate mutase type II [Bacteroidota bacterium]